MMTKDKLRQLTGRSPHGERGLKLVIDLDLEDNDGVAPLTGSVD